jgi:hypothetical protein
MAAARISPWLLAAVLALAWLAVGPDTPDLAAQVYRAGLFEREVFHAAATATARGAARSPACELP